MALIEFVQNQPPYINASNLNHNFNEFKGVVLYNPSTPTTDTNITLNDSATNYSFLEIFYYRSVDGNTSKTYSNIKIDNPNNKRLNLPILIIDNLNIYIFGARYTIENDKLTFLNGGYSLNCQCDPVTSTSSQIYIEKIIGYK